MPYKYVLVFIALTSCRVAIATPVSSQPQNNQTISEPSAYLPAPPTTLPIINFDRQSTEYPSPSGRIISKTRCLPDDPSCGTALNNMTKRVPDYPNNFCAPGYYLYVSKCKNTDELQVVCYPRRSGTAVSSTISCTADIGGGNPIYYCLENGLPEPYKRAKCVFRLRTERWTTPIEGSFTGYNFITPQQPAPASGHDLSVAATALYDQNGNGVSVQSLGFFSYDPKYVNMGSCARTSICRSSVVDWAQTKGVSWVVSGGAGSLTALTYILEDVGL